MKKLYLIPLILFLIWIGYVVGSQMIMRTVPSSGIVAYGDLQLYSDAGGTVNMTSISWGVCYLSETTTRSGYLRNEGTTTVTLGFNTSDWQVILKGDTAWINDTTAESKFEVTTSFVDVVLAPDEIIPVNFNLRPITGSQAYTQFRFNIHILGDDGR